MARYALIAIFLLAGLVLADAQSLQLENTETGRIKLLDTGLLVTVYLQPPTSDMMDCNSRQLEGVLQPSRNGMIRVLPEYERKKYTLNNGLGKVDEVYYENLKGRMPMSLDPANVLGMDVRKPGAETAEAFGGILTTLGALGALVVAPLVSIDYANGTFNGDNYFRWAAYSLGMSGVGVGILLGSKKRNYDIARPGDSKDRKRWAIKL